MTKIYKYRKLHGLKDSGPWYFANIGDEPMSELLAESAILKREGIGEGDKIMLCGSLDEMDRWYVEEPISAGWVFDREYVHKYRSPVYRLADGDRRVSVKLASESWFPGCGQAYNASVAWQALKTEWARHTSLPLLSTPSKTGQALLWESFPRGKSFPSLCGDVEYIVRRYSTQHRLQVFKPEFKGQRWCYDGRWMYAALAACDRFPVGEPVHWAVNETFESRDFEPYVPGWYRVVVEIPDNWAHIGLVPMLDPDAGWCYPNAPGAVFGGWVAEPELTLAQQNGWRVTVFESYTFEKGKPLENWAGKLQLMRERLKERNADFAAAAIRQVLNSAIGSMHSAGYEREKWIPASEFRAWRRDNQHLIDREYELTDGGFVVPVMVPDTSPLSIVMPHWSATIWALERARVAQWALKCDPDALIEIRGDAIYADRELPFEDNGNLGQLRFKGVSNGEKA